MRKLAQQDESRGTTLPPNYPMDITPFAKTLIGVGLAIAAVGALLLLSGGKLPWLGRLPGDIVIKRENFTVYFPLATSIIVSLALTLLLWLFGKK